MRTIEKIVRELTIDELKQGYFELKEWHNTGMLKYGVIRKVHEEFLTATNMTALEFGVRGVENIFLMEIARRQFESE